MRSFVLFICLFVSVFVTALKGQGYWVSVEFDELLETDTFLIVDLRTSSALPNNVGKTPMVSLVELNSEQNMVISEVDNSLKWKISRKANGCEFLVYDNVGNEKVLYCKDANDGVAVGVAPANAATRFFYYNDSEMDYSGLSVMTNGTQRNLCVYNKQDWRSYTNTSKNLKNTNIKYFRFQMDAPGDPSDDIAYHQVTCYCNGTSTVYEVESGSTFILPTEISSYADYDFMGWSPYTIKSQPELDCLCSGQEVVIISDTTFYSVYGLVDTQSVNEPLYKKVVDDRTDWSGKYFIVCEEKCSIYNGNLKTDALISKGNSLEVEITGNKILIDKENADAYFLIKHRTDGTYSVQSNSGYYLGNTSFASGSNYNKSDKFKNEILLDANDNIVIKSSTVPLIWNSSSYFQYNNGKGSAIQLYEYVEDVRVYIKYTTTPNEHTSIVRVPTLHKGCMIYDLWGRGVSNDKSGIYIVNGVKMYLK